MFDFIEDPNLLSPEPPGDLDLESFAADRPGFKPPLCSGKSSILPWFLRFRRTTVQTNAIPDDAMSSADWLFQNRQELLRNINGLILRIRISDAGIEVTRGSKRHNSLELWGNIGDPLPFSRLFPDTQVDALNKYREKRILRAAEIFSSNLLGYQFWTILKTAPDLCHVDREPVKGANFTRGTDVFLWDAFGEEGRGPVDESQVISMPARSECIVPVGQPHRSPFDPNGGLRLWEGVYRLRL